jgi:predicted nucleotidyltransferase
MSMTTLKLPGLDYDTSAIEDFSRRWGVTRMSFFGAAARNELTPEARVGVLVKLTQGSKVSAFGLVEMEQELTALFGRAVHMIEDRTFENPYTEKKVHGDVTMVYAA